jgi:hypothetical protein
VMLHRCVKLFNKRYVQTHNPSSTIIHTARRHFWCLDILCVNFYSVHFSCDVEFAARLKQKNEHSVSVITGLCDYKHQLINHIALRAPKEVSTCNSVQCICLLPT